MAGRPPGQQKKRGSCQTRTAGRFGGKKAAPPPPLAVDTPPHDNDTCYDGDEEDHSSSRHSSSDSSDHGSCSSGSSGRIKYDGKSKRQARRRRKKRRDVEEKRGVRTLLEDVGIASARQHSSPRLYRGRKQGGGVGGDFRWSVVLHRCRAGVGARVGNTGRGNTTRSDDLVTSLPPLRRVAFRGNRCRFGTICAGSG